MLNNVIDSNLENVSDVNWYIDILLNRELGISLPKNCT